MTYDVAVIGLGAMGSATAASLSRMGAKVVGFDRWQPPHPRGSSHGESRITRLGIGEGVFYAPLAIRSQQLWKELESETGDQLLERCGCLIIADSSGNAIVHGAKSFFETTVEAAEQFKVEYETLTANQLRMRFPQLVVQDNERAYIEKDGGFVRPDKCVAANLRSAKLLGADLHFGHSAQWDKSSQEREFVINFGGEKFIAKSLVLAAGPWAQNLAKIELPLTVFAQELNWFLPEISSAYSPKDFPVFIWAPRQGEINGIYGFPVVDPELGMKIATENFARPDDPERPETIPATSGDAFYAQWIKGRLKGIGQSRVKRETCYYTASPDSHFIIDRHPHDQEVFIASPCSGHGFKHSQALGEALAERVLTGQSKLDLSPFSLNRFKSS